MALHGHRLSAEGAVDIDAEVRRARSFTDEGDVGCRDTLAEDDAVGAATGMLDDPVLAQIAVLEIVDVITAQS